MTITIGLWIIPLIITIVAFISALIHSDDDWLGGFFEMVLALLVSLVSWLIWAVITIIQLS